MYIILTFPTKPVLGCLYLSFSYVTAALPFFYYFTYLPNPFGLTSDKYGNRLCLSNTLPAFMISNDVIPGQRMEPYIIYTTLRIVTDVAKCCGTCKPQQLPSLKT